uniref:RNA-binding S4 domain-containing protein n=1 Tax=Brassica campestris TaxID=3711 RepID=M4D773_BRACM
MPRDLLTPLHHPAPNHHSRLETNSFKTVEASLRIDAVASAGFKISRSKLVDLISSGDVRVNWATVTKNGTTVKTGDVVSVSGKGRLKIGEINETKKGKYAVEIESIAPILLSFKKKCQILLIYNSFHFHLFLIRNLIKNLIYPI